MAFKIKILIFVLSVFTLASGALAAEGAKSNKRRPDTGQVARVKIDGAAIYEGPNFDSPVLEYLDTDKKVFISKKIFTGVGGMGAFYKIKLRQGVFGYITDTDVETKRRTDDDAGLEDSEREEKQKPKKVKSQEDEEEARFDGESFYLKRYLGFSYFSYTYAETLRKTKETATVGMFGAQMTGPTGVLGGLPLDITFLFTSTAPKFYDEIATSTKGFMLMGDVLAVLPMIDEPTYMVFYGVGLMWRYSAWDVTLESQSDKPAIDSQELALGVAGEAGAAVRVGGDFVLRATVKYIYEKEGYLGFGAAAQMKF